MTFSRRKPKSPAKSNAGFTLIELMVSASIATIALVGIITMFAMITASAMRVGYYSEMEMQTRRAFEQLGIDARMASNFTATFTNGAITSFTLTIPSEDLTATSSVTYGFDSSDPSNKKFFIVPGTDPTATTNRKDLITGVSALTILRYDTSDTLIPTSTTDSSTIKHLQISVSVIRSGVGYASATQVIRSSAFTIRNISLP